MARYRYPLVAREGWSYILVALAVALSVNHALGVWAAAPLGLLAAFLLFLFRDPPRAVPSSPLAVICPVDGEVKSIEQTTDPWVEREAIRLTIRMGALSVYSVRSPIEGKIVRQWYPRKEMPERVYAQWVQSDENDDVVMIIKRGGLVRRPFCYTQSGERIGQGQRCGYLPFGTEVAVLLPTNCRLSVGVGDRVSSGCGILGTLVRR